MRPGRVTALVPGRAFKQGPTVLGEQALGGTTGVGSDGRPQQLLGACPGLHPCPGAMTHRTEDSGSAHGFSGTVRQASAFPPL